jgi:hypothetical protein
MPGDDPNSFHVVVTDAGPCYGPFRCLDDAEAYVRSYEMTGYRIMPAILPTEGWSYEDIIAREG